MIVWIVLSLSLGCATANKTASGNAAVNEPTATAPSMAKQENAVKMDAAVVGEWDYVIKNLPDGDTKGVLSIKWEGDKYVGTLQGDQGSLQLKNLVIENKELKNASFEAQGYAIEMNGAFAGNTFTGKIRAAGYDFPMTATKKN